MDERALRKIVCWLVICYDHGQIFSFMGISLTLENLKRILTSDTDLYISQLHVKVGSDPFLLGFPLLLSSFNILFNCGHALLG